jgi:hypothetical protein
MHPNRRDDLVVYPRIISTDLDSLRLLAIFGNVERTDTSVRDMERFPLSHDAVFPSLL